MKRFISVLLILATMLSCFMLSVSAENTVISDEGRLPFEDVKDEYWFAEAVEFCYANGIIKGMDEYTFGFSGQLTRAQFVMMLANLEGVDTSTYTVTKFTDVKSNHWYYGVIAWAYNEGIVNGMTESTFEPNRQLTRAELATVMYNYMKDKYTVEISDELLSKYTDKPKEEYWYYESIRYAISAGLITGVTETTILPTGVVTRAQAAVIFKSFMEQYYYGSCEHVFSDADCTNASVCEVCGLVNGLANGHMLTAYDCVTGGKCSVCETEVEPSEILHDFAAATCTVARTCTRCSDTRGEAKGHSFKAATCTAAKTCSVCGTTEGNALGHDFSADRCPRCNTASPFSRLRYAIKSCGDYIYDVHSCVITRYYPEDNCIFFFIYDIALDEVYTVTAYYYDTGADMTMVSLSRNGTVHDFEYVHYLPTGEISFYGEGKINATTYNKDTIVLFSDYEGDASNLAIAKNNASFCIEYSVRNLDFWGSNQCGVEAEDFGFINY